MINIFCLIGPTATGKTALAIELVKHALVEIISVDSAMIYRGMDIGSATPTTEELAQAPHRLINIKDPNQAYSVGEFCQDAKREIKDILAQGKIPLLVGGTMLYFYMLQQGLADLPETDEAVRAQVNQEAGEISWEGMHQKLQAIDPVTAQRLKPTDSQRIGRALEIFYSSGELLSDLLAQQPAQSEYRFTNFVLQEPDRAKVHANIAKRFEQMLAQGFEQEVAALYQRGDLDLSMPSMRCVGYKQMWQYLAGEIDYQQMRDAALAATRQLAKRQYTWLRNKDWGERIDLVAQDSNNLTQILAKLN